MMLIQHSIYTPLIAPGTIPSLCKNHVLGAIKGVYMVTFFKLGTQIRWICHIFGNTCSLFS